MPYQTSETNLPAVKAHGGYIGWEKCLVPVPVFPSDGIEVTHPLLNRQEEGIVDRIVDHARGRLSGYKRREEEGLLEKKV